MMQNASYHFFVNLTYPLRGNTMMALGSSRSKSTKVFRLDPSTLDTSITFLPLSVQYKFLATQSTARPSAVTRSVDIIVLGFDPFHAARL
ncbi:hypothetical protein AVEN_275756-1 [Araneus ventricosus]|uniref:Uncharacterized protein n=1 Tax=Araneus ventricosus TaxID=182803 RepID=A0A4Y2AMM6_ARAVE|nr:hypothetical protein AVEN_275756-1 [Araneus ventricosus]